MEEKFYIWKVYDYSITNILNHFYHSERLGQKVAMPSLSGVNTLEIASPKNFVLYIFFFNLQSKWLQMEKSGEQKVHASSGIMKVKTVSDSISPLPPVQISRICFSKLLGLWINVSIAFHAGMNHGRLISPGTLHHAISSVCHIGCHIQLVMIIEGKSWFLHLH